MEVALYCPDCGYYEKEEDNVGRGGDFFTSVSVGSLFGELLAFQFAEWLMAEADRGGLADGFRIVEAGAHDGRLAADILAWMRERRPEIFRRLEYVIVEPSRRRQEWQREKLKEFQKSARWVSEMSTLKTTAAAPETIIFSNELLDAMPARRLGWDAKRKKWFEWGLALHDGNLVWSRMGEVANEVLESAFRAPEFQNLFDVLPDGFTTEVCPAAPAWWRSAADILQRGRLLTFDYGLDAEDFFTPERSEGTLRAYHHHRLSRDLLASPGGQDITAQVNFTAVKQAGEAAGLKTEALVSQGKLLTQIAEKIWKQPELFGDWTPARTRQFQTLTHPEHLGRPFRVLVQSRQGDCNS